MEQDPLSKLIKSAREAEDKRASHSDQMDEQEKQEFKLNYQREHAVAYLYRKMPYHYFVFKRLLIEI